MSKFRLLFFFSFVNIYFANVDSYFLLYSMYFTSFEVSIMGLLCFQHVFSICIFLSATERHTYNNQSYQNSMATIDDNSVIPMLAKMRDTRKKKLA